MKDINCVSIDNFGLYIDKIEHYEYYKRLYDETLISAIQKIKDDMTRNVRTNQYTENEIKLINEIKRIILSERQTDESGETYRDRRTKTICPNLLRIIGSLSFNTGGKNRRHTNKQKRRKHSHKYRKSRKTRKCNKSS